MPKFASTVTEASPQGPEMEIVGVKGCGEGSSVLSKEVSPVNNHAKSTKE